MPNKLLGPKLKVADMEHASIQIHTDRTMLGPWAEREGAIPWSYHDRRTQNHLTPDFRVAKSQH